MSRRPQLPPRDFAQYRADWRRLAERTIDLLDCEDPSAKALGELGDLAALARSAWTYPAPWPIGNIAAPLMVGALAWARLPSAELRAQLAGGVRCFADAVLHLLVILEADPGASARGVSGREPPSRPFRADIDG